MGPPFERIGEFAPPRGPSAAFVGDGVDPPYRHRFRVVIVAVGDVGGRQPLGDIGEGCLGGDATLVRTGAPGGSAGTGSRLVLAARTACTVEGAAPAERAISRIDALGCSAAAARIRPCTAG